jgi:glycosyltransferase involved in cell wall biosynthesis
MKVLYFHQYFQIPSQAGGTRSYEMARQLVERGHSVCIVCGETAKLQLQPTKTRGIFRGSVNNIEVIQISLPYSNKDGIAKRMWTFIRFATKGIQIALKEDYDLLFATSTPLTAGIPGIISKIFRRKKFIFEVRDLWPELPKALGMKNPFLLFGMEVLELLCYHFADACIGLSPGICEGIAKKSQKGKKIELIPNGCDLNIFRPGDRKNLKLERIKEGDIVAVFMGAHGIANGLDAILNAAAELKMLNRKDIFLVFIGDGNMKKKLIDRATKNKLDHCLFFDPMPKIELSQVIANADIGIMALANVPAFYYGTSPNKFFDYISSGIPVINNYPGWLADLIQTHNCGIVVQPDNAKDFAEGLIYLADHPEKRKVLGMNARKLAEDQFAREMLGNKFVNFLEEA